MARRAWALALLVLAAAPAAAQDLGTLFHTPEERARLDRLRRGEGLERSAVPGAPPPARELTGFVQRSDGRTTVWVDGNAVTLAAPRDAPKIDPKTVRAYAADEGVKVERKSAR